MYNAVLRACRVKWGTSSATRHLTGQQQSRTMVFGQLSQQKDARCAHGVSRSPQDHEILRSRAKYTKEKGASTERDMNRHIRLNLPFTAC